MQIEMNREAVIQGEGILNLIPQRPPIVMVDSFFGFEENRSYSGLTVTTDNLFCEAGRLQEPGIIGAYRTIGRRHVSGLFIPGRVKKFR